MEWSVVDGVLRFALDLVGSYDDTFPPLTVTFPIYDIAVRLYGGRHSSGVPRSVMVRVGGGNNEPTVT